MFYQITNIKDVRSVLHLLYGPVHVDMSVTYMYNCFYGQLMNNFWTVLSKDWQ